MLHPHLVTRLARQLALLSALLPQLVLAVLAPALVLCQESAGGQILELSLAECCGEAEPDEAPDGAPDGAPEQELRASDEDCGDCLDEGLNLSLLRSDEQEQPQLCPCPLLPPVLLPALPHAFGPDRARAPPQRYLGVAPGLRALRTTRLLC